MKYDVYERLRNTHLSTAMTVVYLPRAVLLSSHKVLLTVPAVARECKWRLKTKSRLYKCQVDISAPETLQSLPPRSPNGADRGG